MSNDAYAGLRTMSREYCRRYTVPSRPRRGAPLTAAAICAVGILMMHVSSRRTSLLTLAAGRALVVQGCEHLSAATRWPL